MKIPYFPFYAADWISSNKRSMLTLEEQGIYILLLAVAWTLPNCTLPGDVKEVCRLCHLHLKRRKSVEKVLNLCFLFGSNERQNKEFIAAKERHLSGKKGAKSRWNKEKHLCESDAHPQCQPEPEPEPEPELKGSLSSSSDEAEGRKDLPLKSASKSKGGEKAEGFSKRVEPGSDAFRFANFLADSILSRKSDYKDLANGGREKVIFSWASDFDRMIRIDGRKPEKMKKVLAWSQEDSFWNKNILSAAKFRKQYDQLEMKMQEAGNGLQAGSSRRESERWRNFREGAERARKAMGLGPSSTGVPSHIHSREVAAGGNGKVDFQVIEGAAVEVNEIG